MASRKTNVESLDPGVTIIGEEIRVRGRIDGEEDLRIFGAVEGAITLTETLFVEDGGVVQATVEARDVVVSGIVIGDVTATNSITLNAGAKLVGNVKTPRLIIADGAAFRGEVAMGDTPISAAPRTSVAKATAGRKAAGSSQAAAKVVQTPPRPASTGGSKRRAAAPAKPRPPARSSQRDDDDEVTVVIKHANLRKGEAPPDDDPPPKKKAPARRAPPPKKKKKKKAARARVPARGKRRVSSR